MEYFKDEYVSDRIIRIVDRSHTAIYLVRGDKRACLIDTGVGLGSLKKHIETICDLPYDVILTHGHVDHAGGAGEFKDRKVYLHEADKALMKVHTTYEERSRYLAFNKAADFDQSELIVPLDENDTLALHDGNVFDLGGLHLEILHVPGHTQGMCMVLIREERTILFGDACGVAVMLLDEYASNIHDYLGSLKKVKLREGEYDRVLRNHGTFVSNKENLDNVMECCQRILDGTDDHVPARGLPASYEDAFFAKEVIVVNGHPMTKDGKEGNVAYRPCKIR